MEEERKGFFSDEEHEVMIKAVAYGQGIFHEDDVTRLREWIMKVNIAKCFADMVLDGTLIVDIRGKEFAFRKKEKP